MYFDITNEYMALLKQKCMIESELKTCPKGYIYKKKIGDNDNDIVFRLVRIISSIWQTHPFREGNTRTVIVFAVLLAKSLGFGVNNLLEKRQ